MSDNLPVLRDGLFPTRTERKLGRSLDRLQASASLDVARVRAAEAVECAKVEAIGSVSTLALMEASNMSAAEAFFADRTPHATARLCCIADAGAVAMRNRVTRLDRRLR